jgi:hypothetical protein
VKVKLGSRLRSAVCDTEVIVVRAPVEDIELCCGGWPMELMERAIARHGQDSEARIEGSLAGCTLLGKRYVAANSELEVLCTKAGQGTLTLGASPLMVRNSKPLPSSD